MTEEREDEAGPPVLEPTAANVTLNEHGLPTFVGQPDGYGLQPNGTFRLHLEHPIPFGKQETIEELTFREPRGKDYRAFPLQMEKLDIGQLLQFAAKITGRTDRQIDELGGADVMRVVEVASGFFAGDPGAIGTTP